MLMLPTLSRLSLLGEALVRERLLVMPELDAALAKAIAAKLSSPATELAVHLVRLGFRPSPSTAAYRSLARTLRTFALHKRSVSGRVAFLEN